MRRIVGRVVSYVVLVLIGLVGIAQIGRASCRERV